MPNEDKLPAAAGGHQPYKCEHCGVECETEYDLNIFHRGCRLRAAFPDAVKPVGAGLLSLDISKVKAAMDLQGAGQRAAAGKEGE